MNMNMKMKMRFGVVMVLALIMCSCGGRTDQELMIAERVLKQSLAHYQPKFDMTLDEQLTMLITGLTTVENTATIKGFDANPLPARDRGDMLPDDGWWEIIIVLGNTTLEKRISRFEYEFHPLHDMLVPVSVEAKILMQWPVEPEELE